MITKILTLNLKKIKRQQINSFYLIKNMGKTSKVVVCGMKGVGKTAILEQVIYGNITSQSVR